MIKPLRSWVIRIAMALVAVVGVAGQIGSVEAQDAPPIPTAYSPDIAGCQANPRTYEELLALFPERSTSEAGATLPEAWTVPVGQRADAGTTEMVRVAIDELFACLNGGDHGRFLALFTDRAIQVTFPWLGEALHSGEMQADLSNPASLPVEQRQTILAMGDVMTYGDGHTGVIVTFLDPASENTGAEVLYFNFSFEGDRWLVDEVFDFSDN
jgi:hypothetical protein